MNASTFDLVARRAALGRRTMFGVLAGAVLATAHDPLDASARFKFKSKKRSGGTVSRLA